MSLKFLGRGDHLKTSFLGGTSTRGVEEVGGGFFFFLGLCLGLVTWCEVCLCVVGVWWASHVMYMYIAS